MRIVAETQRCSTSWLQRKMTIGYNRAAKIVEMMERRGLVGPPNGARDREVLDGAGLIDGRADRLERPGLGRLRAGSAQW